MPEAVIEGRLVARVEGEGTLSEGPVYFLQPSTARYQRWGEIPVRKTTHLWEADPLLQPLVGQVVAITGDVIETRTTITIDCRAIRVLNGSQGP
jgi:hypothetical protein